MNEQLIKENLEVIYFEKLIVDACNNTPINKRTQYYVLKDITQKLLEASEREHQIALAGLEKAKQNEQKGGDK